MSWGQWASAVEHRRYMQPVKTRRHCWCGCKTRATHAGSANGITLTAPICELSAGDGSKPATLENVALVDEMRCPSTATAVR